MFSCFTLQFVNGSGGVVNDRVSRQRHALTYCTDECSQGDPDSSTLTISVKWRPTHGTAETQIASRFVSPVSRRLILVLAVVPGPNRWSNLHGSLFRFVTSDRSLRRELPRVRGLSSRHWLTKREQSGSRAVPSWAAISRRSSKSEPIRITLTTFVSGSTSRRVSGRETPSRSQRRRCVYDWSVKHENPKELLDPENFKEMRQLLTDAAKPDAPCAHAGDA